MGYHDAMKYGETNVGLGMIPSKEERSREDWHSLLVEHDRLTSLNRELVETLLAVQRLDYFQEHSALANQVRAILAKVKSTQGRASGERDPENHQPIPKE